MILALHEVTGAALGSSTYNVYVAAIFGLVSHYFLDTISHTDYDMGKVENGELKMSAIAPLKIAADLLIGALVIYFALRTGRLYHVAPTIVGAFFGLLPDGLAFLNYHVKNKDRNIFTKFLKYHAIMHDKIHEEAELPIIQYFCQIIVVLVLIYFIFR